MERYTRRLDDGQAAMNCYMCDANSEQLIGSKCTALYCRNRLKDRVADYEDVLCRIRDMNQLYEILEFLNHIPHICDLCIGCEIEPEDGHGCDGNDSFVFQPNRLADCLKRIETAYRTR